MADETKPAKKRPPVKLFLALLAALIAGCFIGGLTSSGGVIKIVPHSCSEAFTSAESIINLSSANKSTAVLFELSTATSAYVSEKAQCLGGK